MDSSWNQYESVTYRGRKEPIVSVGNNIISFNLSACNLLANPFEFYYVMVGSKIVNGITLVGFEFVRENTNNTFVLSRKYRTDKRGKKVPTGGFDISNKALVTQLFGTSASASTKHYSVTRDNNNKNMLVVAIS